MTDNLEFNFHFGPIVGPKRKCQVFNEVSGDKVKYVLISHPKPVSLYHALSRYPTSFLRYGCLNVICAVIL